MPAKERQFRNLGKRDPRLIFSALLFSLTFNMDNMVIGAAYGMKKIKIGFTANLIIAAITTIGTYLSMTLGTYISQFLPDFCANAIGAAAVVLLGLYFSLQSIVKLTERTKPKELALKDVSDMMEYAQESDRNHNGKIDYKEAILVAVGLMVNNLGTGIAASITKVNLPLTILFTFILSLVTLVFGEVLGTHALGKLFGKYASLFSGLLLILLGIFEFFH
ncbi:MAG: sporulation membrane protein YtaF [Ruminococcaceae bacterium]|nr:sporulation membrane protein YtaF [Oscillospiraceae bacterium]HHV31979.1 sporulation membrane protein YtaF [Clostridiales bacterium]